MKRFLSLAFLFLIGCMSPETGTAARLDNPESGVVDENLRAGATSSTNWPSEDAFPDQISVRGRADTELQFFFYDFLTPKKISGKVSFFKGGAIPALDPVQVFSYPFSEKDTLSVPDSLFMALKGFGEDTVRFTVKIETDSAQCLFFGFSYSAKNHNFIDSPFSIPSSSSAVMTPARFYFKGNVDTTLAILGPSIPGKTEWCFYIPGSPFFWNVKKVGPGDTLEIGKLSIGKLPTGKYPLRLIRILAQEANARMNLLEVYSVKVTIDISVRPNQVTLGVGDKIISREIRNSISIRAETM